MFEMSSEEDEGDKLAEYFSPGGGGDQDVAVMRKIAAKALAGTGVGGSGSTRGCGEGSLASQEGKLGGSGRADGDGAIAMEMDDHGTAQQQATPAVKAGA